MFIGVVDFKGQYNHLIWRRIIELGCEAELFEPNLSLDDVERRFDGLILSGGSYNLPEDLDKIGYALEYALRYSKPILGICLGHHIIAYAYGGKLSRSNPEFGGVTVHVIDEDDILRGMGMKFTAWESHNVEVAEPPKNFKILAYSDKVKVQAMKHVEKPIYSVQFHPEVRHTEKGEVIFKNFIELCRR